MYMGKVLILSGGPILKGQKADGLAKNGLQVTVVPSYIKGMHKIDQEEFDVVIIDDKLRGGDIYQACRQVRQSSEALIILLGRKTDKEMRARAEELGFDRYYKKPIAPKELLARVQVILSHAPTEDKAKRISEEKVAEVPKAEVMPLPEAPEPEAISSQSASEPGPVPEEAPSKIWQSTEALNIVAALMRGKLTEIKPVIDLSLKDGFTYPEADAIMETSGRETAQILESLAEEDVLLRQPFEKLLLSPEGSAQLVPVERCPYCDSASLSKGQVLEHFACGYVGLDEDFRTGLRYVCPKCKRELKLIGTDYHSPGFRYRCGYCNEIFPLPTIKYRCLRTGKTCSLAELGHVWLYLYHLNEAKRNLLDFELEPKAILIDFLRCHGYEVEEAARVQGQSGAIHTIDILATRDDWIAKHTIAIGIVAAQPSNAEVLIDELFNFDTKAYDIGIHDRVLIVIPKLSVEARKFAERQGMRVYEFQEFKTMFSEQIAEVPLTEMAEKVRQAEEFEPELAKVDPKAWLIRFLESRGYEVTEEAKVIGKSGAEHLLDIYAQKDEVIVTHTLAAVIATAGEGEEITVDVVSQFDTKAYDTGIRDKILIATSKLSPAARQLAKQQGIKVIEPKEQQGVE